MSSGSDSDSVLSQSDFPETVDRFWGMAVSSDEPQRLSLTSSILRISMACLTKGKSAMVFVTTEVTGRMAVCHLTATRSTSSVKVMLFNHDESALLEVEGDGVVHLTGTVQLDMFALLADESDSEGEDAEAAAEAAAEPAAKASKAKGKAKAAKVEPAAKSNNKKREAEVAPAQEAEPASTKKAKRQKKQKASDAEVAGAGAGAGAAAKGAAAKDAAAKAKSPKPAVAAPKAKEVRLPNGLRIKDAVVGLGPKPVKGRKVSVHYVGKLADGTVFDKSKRPFEFRLGIGKVIKGWDDGVSTMRVGGKRRLVVPPKLAYGKKGIPGVIPQNATLTFDVELLKTL